MQYVTQADLDRVEADMAKKKKDRVEVVPSGSSLLDESSFAKLLSDLENPIVAQRQLAVRIKVFIESHIDEEIKVYGKLSEYTRRWVKEYNEILDRLQKNTYGEKSISLHIHKVSHSDIAQKIRKYKLQNEDSEVVSSDMEIPVEAEVLSLVNTPAQNEETKISQDEK